MIIDLLQNAGFYHGLTPRLTAGLQFLASADCRALAPGRHEIDGKNLFMLIQDYATKPRAQGVWEAHRKYIDIQHIVTGAEIIGCAPRDALVQSVTQPYAEEKDCELFDGSAGAAGNFFRMESGAFAVFAPPDAHMPGLSVDSPAPVRKAVVKVLI